MKKLALAISLGVTLATSGIGRAEPPATIPTAKAAERAKQLKAGIKSFRLELLRYGDEDKPFYRVILSVPLVPDRSNPFYRSVQITEEQAEEIVEHLVESGFLDRARDIEAIHPDRVPLGPRYILNVRAKPGQAVVFQEDLGWGLPMLERLDGLREVLDGDAAKGMDLLLGRLSGLRKQWEKKPVGNWKKLYEDEPWYKNHKQPEQVFRGTLQRHQEPEFSTLMRPHRYKLGDRFIYPGKEHPELEKLIGQEVEVRGKRYDVELEGQSVREIWPSAVRAMASVDSETATLAQALGDWIVLLEANKVETAQKRWAKASGTADEMKQWWTTLGECHKQYEYRKWLERAEQIGDATQFKVGGHSFGHMHVDWEKTQQGWRISKVWICR